MLNIVFCDRLVQHEDELYPYGGLTCEECHKYCSSCECFEVYKKMYVF